MKLKFERRRDYDRRGGGDYLEIDEIAGDPRAAGAA